ncbi:hypothetical protein HN014_08125 [Aquimarina sp. TRL1]|uniref:hypothetical protein n=1 Tax=Aquimarina sp. (strain TRL1) TaxID=2736252 RepID=UPI00158A0BB3|nr:hypothetical protein [Aquimarina sp. TRL1]QKX04885.1 hypothetical protein HN014_08125 [Aquimarina sp. TRL1]
MKTVVDQQQIDKWKSEHPEGVFRLKSDKYGDIYIHTPDRPTLGFAMSASREDPLAMSETILENCWLEGDEKIKTDKGALMGILPKIDEILEVKAIEVEKL